MIYSERVLFILFGPTIPKAATKSAPKARLKPKPKSVSKVTMKPEPKVRLKFPPKAWPIPSLKPGQNDTLKPGVISLSPTEFLDSDSKKN